MRVSCFFDDRDFESLQVLRRVLAPLQITVWGRDQIEAGRVTAQEIQSHLERDDVLLFLMSADLFVYPQAQWWMRRALQRHQAGQAQVIPILVRPSLFEASPLGSLQALPRDGQPLTLMPAGKREFTFVEIAREIASAIRYSPARTASSGPKRPEDAPPIEIHELHQIFPVFVDVKSTLDFATLVEPAQYRQLVAFLKVPGQGLVVEGPSGSGKSIAVRKALQEIGVTEPRWLQCSDEQDLLQLDEILKQRVSSYLVIDDFHYLDTARQATLARHLQTGSAGAKFVLIGVNEVRTSLVQRLPDLGRRLMSVPMGLQPEEKIAELISKGEAAANVEFLHRASFITAAAGSFFIAQNLCYFAAAQAGVERTQTETKAIALDASQVMTPLMESLRGQFNGHLAALVARDEVTPPRGATLVLLWLLGQERHGYIEMETARRRYPALSPAFDWLGRGNLADALKSIDHLSRYLHFDATSGILTCQDPQLLFYLRHLPWAELIRDTGHLYLRFEFLGLKFEINYAPSVATSPAGLNAQAGGLPQTLIDALHAGRLVPFAGAGVSMAVHDMRRTGQQEPRLFPSWPALLEEAAKWLDRDQHPGDAMAVRGALTKRHPSFLEAAQAARDGLGAVFYRLLREVFDPPAERVAPESLALARALWRLGSKLVVTTNYDRVLQWACPEPWKGDLRRWDIQAEAGLSDLLREGGVSRPTVWHLHGHIDHVDDLILTPDGYSLLYAERPDQEPRYQAAKTSLQILMASRTLLFVGFSFKDERFGDQLRWMNEVFRGTIGPHYLILRDAEQDAARERLRGLPLEILTVQDSGTPLLKLLDDMARLRGG